MARRAVRVGLGAGAVVVVLAGAAVAVAVALPARPAPGASPRTTSPAVAATSAAVPSPGRSPSCAARVPGDTDGDGRSDVVIGAPLAAGRAGRATVLVGSAKGLVPRASLAPGSGGLPRSPDPTPRFGSAVAMGDVDGDGCADAVIADAAGDATGGTDIGGLTVLLGAPRGGLTATGAVRLDAGSMPLGASPLEDSGDRVTRAIGTPVVGDFDGDGFDDVAFVVTVTADGPGVTNSLVSVVPGGPTGLQPLRTRRLEVQALPTGLDAPPLYGVGLAAGDVDGDGIDDLAVTAGTRTDLLLGARSGLDTGGAQQIVETVLPDVADETLRSALGDLNGDGHADLAVASPTAKRVLVYPGSTDGLDDTAPHDFAPGTGGLPGARDQDGFAAALTTGDLDGDGAAELVVGGGGAVWVLPGGSAGATGDGSVLLTPRTLGTGTAGGGFGSALAVGRYRGGRGEDLLVTDPEGAGRAGSVTVVLGGPAGIRRTGAVVLSEATPGVPAEPRRGDGFGVLPE